MHTKRKIEIQPWRVALNIDTELSELMAPHMLRFTTAQPTATKKGFFDIYFALKIRFPKIVYIGRFIQSETGIPHNIPKSV